MLRRIIAVWALAGFACGISCLRAADDFARTLDAKRHHLGTAGLAEWAEFEASTPEGRDFKLTFTATINERPQTLLIRQRDVKQSWSVLLNRRKLGQLELTETPTIAAFTIPPGTLRTGENVLEIQAPKAIDDIEVGEIILDARPSAKALREGMLEIAVTDVATRRGLPCRLTIVEGQGAYAPLSIETNAALAVRPGVIYSRDGVVSLPLRAGDYTLYAGRGFEYSVCTQRVSVARGERKSVALTIQREVATPGWVAADTHIHTLTYSGHGDASIDERMLTIAGEGIELPIATDHNHHTDYSEPALRAQLRSHFTPVMGNEVTTAVGHFNAFPIKPGSVVADFKSTDWAVLLNNLRATPGVKVITLNHPRDLHGGFIPFASTNLNPVSGEVLQGRPFDFDAIEVITSGAMQSDVMLLFHDWFALLNGGHRVSAIASSDTHDVSRFILGQGRTYVACDDSNLDHLDIDQACRSFREGRLLVSLGLLAQITVDGRAKVGDTVVPRGKEMTVNVEVGGPGWVQADRVELFCNGVKIREAAVTPAGGGIKTNIQWRIPSPTWDVHLVAVASGPGVTAPFWEIPKPYQPASKQFTPRVLAATNPVWVDADHDGKFTSARGYAERILREQGTTPGKLLPALKPYDEAVAAQAAALCHAAGIDMKGSAFQAALAQATPAVQRGFADYLKTLR